MGNSISILRLFSVLSVFLALAVTLFAEQIGASAARGAADAAAIAVTDRLPADWDCSQADLPSDVGDVAARTVVDRTAQLAAVLPTKLEVRADGTCSVLVSLSGTSEGWLGARSALAVACRRPASAQGAALRAPVAPPC